MSDFVIRAHQSDSRALSLGAALRTLVTSSVSERTQEAQRVVRERLESEKVVSGAVDDMVVAPLLDRRRDAKDEHTVQQVDHVFVLLARELPKESAVRLLDRLAAEMVAADDVQHALLWRVVLALDASGAAADASPAAISGILVHFDGRDPISTECWRTCMALKTAANVSLPLPGRGVAVGSVLERILVSSSAPLGIEWLLHRPPSANSSVRKLERAEWQCDALVAVLCACEGRRREKIARAALAADIEAGFVLQASLALAADASRLPSVYRALGGAVYEMDETVAAELVVDLLERDAVSTLRVLDEHWRASLLAQTLAAARSRNLVRGTAAVDSRTLHALETRLLADDDAERAVVLAALAPAHAARLVLCAPVTAPLANVLEASRTAWAVEAVLALADLAAAGETAPAVPTSPGAIRTPADAAPVVAASDLAPSIGTALASWAASDIGGAAAASHALAQRMAAISGPVPTVFAQLSAALGTSS